MLTMKETRLTDIQTKIVVVTHQVHSSLMTRCPKDWDYIPGKTLEYWSFLKTKELAWITCLSLNQQSYKRCYIKGV